MLSITTGIHRIDDRFEEYKYRPIVEKILAGTFDYGNPERDVQALCAPDLNLIKWIMRIGGETGEAVGAIMGCVYRGLITNPYSATISGEIKSKKERKMRAYNYVPSSRESFVRHVLPVFYGKRNFVDVGSGYGDKVVLAHVYGYFENVSGIELNDFTYHSSVLMLANLFPNVYYGQSSKAFGYNINLFNMNAFDVDFGNYDAIYMYMPIAEHTTMSKLHAHIINTMPEDGILYETQSGLFNRRIMFEDYGWLECRCKTCKRNDGDCANSDEKDFQGIMTLMEWFDYCDAPIKRNIEVSKDGHAVTIRR